LGACVLPRPPLRSDLGYTRPALRASAAGYIRLLTVAPEQIDRVVRPKGPVLIAQVAVSVSERRPGFITANETSPERALYLYRINAFW